MFNRWFFSGTAVLTIAALVLAIYLDNRDGAQQSIRNSTVFNEYSSNRSGFSRERTAPDADRLDHIISVLDTLQDKRSRLPYYGEMIRIHSEAGFFYKAGLWAEKRAKATDLADDWAEAAWLYFEEVRLGSDDESSAAYGLKSESAYLQALERRPDDTDLLTDLAAVYMGLLKPEASYSVLKRALESDPDHLRANFNAGVLLHHMGSTDKSILYLDRALALAENSEWETVVQGYLDRHHHDIYY